MLNLKQGANTVAVTLNEKGDHLTPFVVRLTSKSTKASVSFTATDDSPHPERYNRLTFDIGDLGPGQYDYVIESSTSPSIELESGIAVVESDAITPSTYSAADQVKTWKG
jgi:hypothetical protein